MPDVDLGKYLNPAILKSVEKLELQAQCLVEGFLSGRHKSPFQGSSNQFSEYRHYAPGDSLKSIDWSVYAKTEKHFIKKFEAETDLDCHLCLDISSSMGYKSQNSEFSKLEYSIILSAALAYMTIKQRDNIGLISYDDAVKDYLKPKNTNNHLSRLISTLAQVTPVEKSDFSQALPQALKLLKKKGIVIIFSDFLGDHSKILDGLAMMRARKHDVIVFHILDKAEIELPFESITEFVDSENNNLMIKANPQDIRLNYQQEIENFTLSIKEHCEKMAIDYCLVNSSNPFDHALEKFLLKRKRCF